MVEEKKDISFEFEMDVFTISIQIRVSAGIFTLKGTNQNGAIYSTECPLVGWDAKELEETLRKKPKIEYEPESNEIVLKWPILPGFVLVKELEKGEAEELKVVSSRLRQFLIDKKKSKLAKEAMITAQIGAHASFKNYTIQGGYVLGGVSILKSLISVEVLLNIDIVVQMLSNGLL